MADSVNDSNPVKHQNGDAIPDEDTNLRIVGDPDTSCGCGACAPSCIQCCANPKLFTAHCTALLATMACSYAYFGGVLTTIERQFQLSSSESGSITIINDVVNLSIVVFASYFGHDSHRPRWVAVGTILSGVGTLIFTMPHFTSDPVDSSDILYGIKEEFSEQGACSIGKFEYQPEQNLTMVDRNSTFYMTERDECASSSGGLGPIWWIVIGNVLVGIGSAPLYPLITTYIDDAVGKRRLVSYMGRCL